MPHFIPVVVKNGKKSKTFLEVKLERMSIGEGKEILAAASFDVWFQGHRY
jgi:hypothetical protein